MTISGLPAGKVQVFDAAGRLVLSVQSDGSDSQTIDISGLAPGVHIVRAGSQSARLMVM
ncbi:MAG: T9SS type A sorting domain-containing protein [Bacteroidales bacterium]|nr:T9SS type A sorting domain-containing protein [Bacteroidales bacterium]